MATKKQDTTATTEQEKPRAIMDLISIYDIIGGSYNLGEKLWDYLTQEEQAELLKADKEYKQWRSKTLRETGEETTKKIKLPNDAEGFKDTAKELYYKARGRLWDDIKNDKEKLKKYAAEHIKGLSYAAFSFRQAVLFLDYFQDRDFGSWSYDENREEGERFQRSEASPEELELKRAKLTDYKDLAENVIDEAINKYEAQFIDISEEETEEALKEWTAYIKPYKDKKVNEWVKEAKKKQAEIEKDQSGKTLAEIAKETLNKLKPSDKYKIPNSRLYNSYASVEKMLSLEADNQQSMIFLGTSKTLEIDRGTNTGSYCIVSMGAATDNGTIPACLKGIKGYEQAFYHIVGNMFYEARRQGLPTALVSIDDILKELKGKNKRISDNEREKAMNCLRKYGARIITIDMTHINDGEESKEKTKRRRKAPNDEEIISDEIKGRLLDFRERDIITQKGTKLYAIEILAEPILFTYSRYLHQILSIPKIYWSVLEDLKRISDKHIEFREPLIKHLWQIHKGYYNNNCIRFDTLLKDAGWTDKEIQGQTPKQAFDNRKIIKDLLDAYVKKGLIEKYEDYFDTEGKSLVVVGWKITDIPEKALTDGQEKQTTSIE